MKVILTVLAMLVAQSALGATVSATLGASTQSVDKPQGVVLSWGSSGAAKCTASGGWSGAKALSGTETVQVTKTTSFTLTCESPTGPATLKWTPPTSYTDGTPLTVKNYIVLSGVSQAVLDGSPNRLEVPAPASSAVVQVPPGLTYFALRAADAAGVESASTASVTKQVVPDTSAPQVQVSFSVKPNPPTNFTVE